MIFNLYKQRGETPLECIKRFVQNNPKLAGDKMTYLGRLDPLAEGVLLVASGEDTKQKRREEFLGLDKEYEFSAFFGFATDTYDVMGKIIKTADFAKGFVAPKEMDLIKICKIYEGEREQKYPPYSSKIISMGQKKSSFSKSPRLPDMPPRRAGISSLRSARLFSKDFFSGPQIPVKKITIYKLQFHKLETMTSKELFGRILADISRVRGDFRQMEILEGWKERLLCGLAPRSPAKRDEVGVGLFSAHVSSGTYIRGIVNDMGNTFGCGATVLSIKRTRVGDFKIEDSILPPLSF